MIVSFYILFEIIFIFFQSIFCRRNFYDQRIAQEIDGEALGEEWAGYIFRISGGNDQQGFPMKQGVICNHRVRLLLTKVSF